MQKCAQPKKIKKMCRNMQKKLENFKSPLICVYLCTAIPQPPQHTILSWQSLKGPWSEGRRLAEHHHPGGVQVPAASWKR